MASRNGATIVNPEEFGVCVKSMGAMNLTRRSDYVLNTISDGKNMETQPLHMRGILHPWGQNGLGLTDTLKSNTKSIQGYGNLSIVWLWNNIWGENCIGAKRSTTSIRIGKITGLRIWNWLHLLGIMNIIRKRDEGYCLCVSIAAKHSRITRTCLNQREPTAASIVA
jgi:hypothetical protein